MTAVHRSRLAGSRLSVRLRATVAVTAIVAVALGAVSAVLLGVLSGSLQDSAAVEAARRAAATADLLVARAPAGTATAPIGAEALGAEPVGAGAVEPDVLVVADPGLAAAGDRATDGGQGVVTWAPEGAYAVAVRPVRTAEGEVLCRRGRRSSRPRPRSPPCRPCCCPASPRCSCWWPG